MASTVYLVSLGVVVLFLSGFIAVIVVGVLNAQQQTETDDRAFAVIIDAGQMLLDNSRLRRSTSPRIIVLVFRASAPFCSPCPHHASRNCLVVRRIQPFGFSRLLLGTNRV